MGAIMKRSLLISLVLGLAVVVVSSPVAFAQNCGNPPSTSGSMGAWAKAYATWCGCMHGKFDANRGACVGAGGGGNPGASQPSYDANAAAAAAAAAEAERQREIEAEQQRQREAEEQRLRDEEAAKQRQAEFERKKQEALSSMKGIAEGELGLKGDGAGDLGLKDLGDTNGGLKDAPNSPASPSTTAAKKLACQWGDQGASVVDLRCLGLDPDKPVVLDWHVVRGQQRAFPAQIDPATLQNTNYHKGFLALMRLTFSVQDAVDAVAFFKQAQLQRPNDPLVRNGLLLAQDMVKARQQKVQEDKDRAMQSLYHGLAALMTGDAATASDSAKRASQLDPGNRGIANWNLTLAVMSVNFKSPQLQQKNAELAIGNALLSEAFGDYAAEVREMEMAKRLAPESTYVDEILAHAKHLSEEFPVHNAMHPAP
jgi:hypothetical protein